MAAAEIQFLFGLVCSFILGSVFGSFGNVCIFRWPRGGSVFYPKRSHCMSCDAQIAGYDNIPMLSYILLNGRCRHCGASFSIRYFFVEFLTACLFTMVYYHFCWHGWNWAAPVFMLWTFGLVVASFIDWDEKIIPDEISFYPIPLAWLVSFLVPSLVGWGARWGVGYFWPVVWPHLSEEFIDNLYNGFPHLFVFVPQTILVRLISGQDAVVGASFGLVVGGGSVWLIRIVGSWVMGREAMGMGDVKLMALNGALLGWWRVLLGLGLGAMLAVAVYALSMLRPQSSDDTSDGFLEIPFGPFLSLGSWIAMLWGPWIVVGYLEFSHTHPQLFAMILMVVTLLLVVLLVVHRQLRFKNEN